MRDKFEIANLLRATGVLLSVKGANPFKSKAYLTGANALESLSEDIDTVIAENRLTTVSGIGASLSAFTKELYENGESQLFEIWYSPGSTRRASSMRCVEYPSCRGVYPARQA